MRYPSLSVIRRSTEITDVFSGYNHSLRIADGEFYDMQNLSSDAWPVLTQRARRAQVRAGAQLQAIGAKDGLVTVEGGVIYLGERSMQPYMQGVTLSPGRKQLVMMGAYVCVFPDGFYLSTENYLDNGFLARKNTLDAAQTPVAMTVCTQDGAALTITYRQPAMPANPANGAYWLDTSGPVHTLKVYSAYSAQWSSVPTAYVKLAASGIGAGLARYDGVQLRGLAGSAQIFALNGAHTLYSVSDDAVVIAGLLDESATQSTGTVTLERALPEMDFVTACGNRLWGCRYGSINGLATNELYCCRLGDFKNWQSYLGTAADSWRASVGSAGPFTGAASFGDSPIFFKEDCIHRVYPSSAGAHQVVEIGCDGLQSGSSESVCAVDGRLYYKSRMGVCMYDGSLPVSISAAFGSELYHGAAAGGARGKYFLSMADSSGAYHLFVYDTHKRLWHREDGLHALAFARVGDELFAQQSDGTLTALFGTQGTPEGPVPWSATTGILTSGQVGRKYVSRLNLRMVLPKGSTCDVWLEYDSSGVWEHAGHIEGRGTRTFLLPVCPVRCDHLRLRLSGRGSVRLLSLARIVEAGSDG